jgi:hypothetical protein
MHQRALVRLQADGLHLAEEHRVLAHLVFLENLAIENRKRVD